MEEKKSGRGRKKKRREREVQRVVVRQA